MMGHGPYKNLSGAIFDWRPLVASKMYDKSHIFRESTTSYIFFEVVESHKKYQRQDPIIFQKSPENCLMKIPSNLLDCLYHLGTSDSGIEIVRLSVKMAFENRHKERFHPM